MRYCPSPSVADPVVQRSVVLPEALWVDADLRPLRTLFAGASGPSGCLPEPPTRLLTPPTVPAAVCHPRPQTQNAEGPARAAVDR